MRNPLNFLTHYINFAGIILPFRVTLAQIKDKKTKESITLDNRLLVTVSDGQSKDSLPLDFVSEALGKKLLMKAFPLLKIDTVDAAA